MILCWPRDEMVTRPGCNPAPSPKDGRDTLQHPYCRVTTLWFLTHARKMSKNSLKQAINEQDHHRLLGRKEVEFEFSRSRTVVPLSASKTLDWGLELCLEGTRRHELQTTTFPPPFPQPNTCFVAFMRSHAEGGRGCSSQFP